MIESVNQICEKSVRYLDVSFDHLKLKKRVLEENEEEGGKLNAEVTAYMENLVYQFARQHVSEEDSQRYLFHFKKHRLLPEVVKAKHEEEKANRPKKERVFKTYTEEEKVQMAVRAKKRYIEKPEIRLKMAASHRKRFIEKPEIRLKMTVTKITRRLRGDKKKEYLEISQKIIDGFRNRGKIEIASKALVAAWAQLIMNELPLEIDCQVHNNVATVKCARCGKRFETTHRDLSYSKKRYETEGDAYLYCSRACKDACPVFGFKTNWVDPRSKLAKKPNEKQKARKCQTKELKQLQCDEFGYNYCEKCGDIIIDINEHHTLPVAKYGLESISQASHILLCLQCHRQMHSECKQS